MELIKDLYPSADDLFDIVTVPETDYNTEIEDAVYRRWRLYAPVMEDPEEWAIWFQEVCSENWPIAAALMESASLIEDPLKTMDISTVTEGTDDLTDTLKIERDRESADATSGYDNTNSSSETENTDTPGVVVTNKNSDTPQSAVSNLTDGYLSSVQQSSSTGSDSSAGSVSGESARNYLDASSHNASETEEHSGGTGREYGSTVTQTGFQGNQAQLLLEYRKTLANIRRQVADLFHEAFLLVYLPFDE